uniref:RING-type domain-containing protein n=1 Tax=Ananas comosus var. bracteatus TaxID=296719 RepID=A0A6V7PFK4_ANACO|nr:unnamed protein product [Ananas comosus var. bracteatus]
MIKSLSQRLIPVFLASPLTRALASCFEIGEGDQECAICLSVIRKSDKQRVLRCRHAFHRSCLDGWMEHEGRTCPLCRDRLSKVDDPNRESALQRILCEGDTIVLSPFCAVDLDFNIQVAWWLRERNIVGAVLLFSLSSLFQKRAAESPIKMINML